MYETHRQKLFTTLEMKMNSQQEYPVNHFKEERSQFNLKKLQLGSNMS